MSACYLVEMDSANTYFDALVAKIKPLHNAINVHLGLMRLAVYSEYGGSLLQ